MRPMPAYQFEQTVEVLKRRDVAAEPGRNRP
jgi:hypothetical protein